MTYWSAPPSMRGNYEAIVSQRASDYTITRPVETKGEMGVYTDDASTKTHPASVYLHAPSANTTQQPHGERDEGSLRGLALDSEDIEQNDRLVKDSVEYAIMNDPVRVGTTNVVQFSLTRVND